MKSKLISIKSQMDGDIARQNKILHQWITLNYGPRCPTYERGCIVCEAWEYYDALRIVDSNEDFSLNEPENARMFERLRKKQADEFVKKIKNSPGAFGYLKGLVH